MDTLNGKTDKRPLLLRLLSVLLLAVVCALLYLGTVLFPQESDPEAGTRAQEDTGLGYMTAGEYTDMSILRREAGYPLIAFNESFLAQAESLSWMGRTAHRIVIRFSSGLQILSVSPAEAAPLIRQEGMTFSDRDDLKVLQMDAALAVGDEGACLYFSSAQAAYCLYGPGMTDEDVIRASRTLTQANVR